MRRALATIEVGRDDDAPETDPDWGEPGLSLAERLFGWNTLEVLAYKTGNPDNPVGAIPGRAAAACNLRFVVGTDWRAASDILRAHLDAHGFGQVQVKVRRGTPPPGWTRTMPGPLGRGIAGRDHRRRTRHPAQPGRHRAQRRVLGRAGTAHDLGAAFYPACCQHGPDEHLLAPVARQAMAIMAGLFWDLGEQGPAVMAERQAATAG